MALDRQFIEKKDFPIGRRGYDPEAVDTHLSSLADEIADLRRSARRRSDTLASSASDQVRAIVEAAENSAADIQREAEEEARDIREEASNEARSTRDQASEQAREYVGNVSEATNTMLGRIEAMEQELSTLVESLRTGGNRLSADLQLLESDLSSVSDVVTPRPRFEPEASEQPAAEPAAQEPMGDPAAEQPVIDEAAGGYDPPYYDPPAADEQVSAEEPTVAEDAVDGGERLADGDEWVSRTSEVPADYEPADHAGEEGDDAEGARLIALNMALNGTPREETERYLEENFQLSDAGGLLDEVYASVEG